MLFFIFFCFIWIIVVAHDNRVQSYKINARKLSSRIVFFIKVTKIEEAGDECSVARWLFLWNINAYRQAIKVEVAIGPLTIKMPQRESLNLLVAASLMFLSIRQGESLEVNLLAYILRNGILVDHEVHRVGGYEGFGHIPDTLVIARLAP